jgi:23S rRNA pseudouridine2605 synthase
MARVEREAAGASDTEEPSRGEKLQKVLARLGLGSRREMEQWIEQGRLGIDGRPAKLGDRVLEGQRIDLDGRRLERGETATRCLIYNKPAGEVCSRKDPEGRKTVFERLPRVRDGRWISIGRLDYNTSGLLLFTTDGELANALMHPSANIDREYLVRVKGQVEEEQLQAMMEGVLLEDGVARFTDIQPGRGDEDSSNRWFYVVLMEGRNREVRRLWESQGLQVSRLKRVRYGEVFLPSKLKKGQFAELEPREAEVLYRMAGQTAKPVATPTPDERKRQERRQGKKRVDGAGKRGKQDKRDKRHSAEKGRGGDKPRARGTGKGRGARGTGKGR